MVYKAGKRTGVETINLYILISQQALIQLMVLILQKRQDWEPPEIKDLRLVIPEHYTFMASNTIFITVDTKLTQNIQNIP